jgi:hypothetical protein
MNKTSIFVPSSKNGKIGREGSPVSATYASIKGTCPSSCPLKDGGGCYAQYGNVALHVRRIDEAVTEEDPRDLARAEAKQIRESFGGGPIPDGRPLRIHISGDARTPSAVKELASAAFDWIKRGGGRVWRYTHAWEKVLRLVWGAVSVLASVESIDDAARARRRGYAVAMVVAEHPADGKAWKDPNGTTWIPCPAQTRDRACVDCGLCMNDTALFERNAGITFAAHGVKTKAVKSRLSLKIVEA